MSWESINFQAETVECAPDIVSEPKDEKIEDSKSTEENQESRKDFTKDDDGDEEIGCLGSHNKDLGMEKSEEQGSVAFVSDRWGEKLFWIVLMCFKKVVLMCCF